MSLIPPYNTTPIKKFFFKKQPNIEVFRHDHSANYEKLGGAKKSLFGELTYYYTMIIKSAEEVRIPSYFEPGNFYILSTLDSGKFYHFSVHRSYFDHFLQISDPAIGYYEVLSSFVKFFLDADYVPIHKISIYLKDACEFIKGAFKEALNEIIANDQIIFMRSTPDKIGKDGGTYASFHIVVNSIKSFEDIKILKKFCEDNRFFRTSEDGGPLMNFDKQVYKEGQKFRIVGSIKADRDNERRKLKLCNIDGEIEEDIGESLIKRMLIYTDTLITYLDKADQCYDLPKVEETLGDQQIITREEFCRLLDALGFTSLWKFAEENNLQHVGDLKITNDNPRRVVADNSEIQTTVPAYMSNDQIVKLFTKLRMIEGDSPRMVKLGMMILEVMIQSNSNYNPLTLPEIEEPDFTSDHTNFENLWFGRTKSPKDTGRFYDVDRVIKSLGEFKRNATLLNLETNVRTVIIDMHPMKDGNYRMRYIEFNKIGSVAAFVEKEESGYTLSLMIKAEGKSEIVICVQGIVGAERYTRKKIIRRQVAKSLVMTMPVTFAYGSFRESKWFGLQEGEIVDEKYSEEQELEINFLTSFHIKVSLCEVV